MMISSDYTDKYNELLSVEEAAGIIALRNIGDIRQKVGKVLRSANCSEFIGIRLLHRHNKLDKNKFMLEHKEYGNDQEVQLITEPHTYSFATRCVPSVWGLSSCGEPIVFEYCEYNLAGKSPGKIKEVMEVSKEIAAIIKCNEVINIIGLCLIDKDIGTEIDYQDRVAVERTDSVRDANIVRFERKSGIDKSRLIETTWPCDVRAKSFCRPSCYSYCVQYSPGHAVEHFSNHFLPDDSPLPDRT